MRPTIPCASVNVYWDDVKEKVSMMSTNNDIKSAHVNMLRTDFLVMTKHINILLWSKAKEEENVLGNDLDVIRLVSQIMLVERLKKYEVDFPPRTLDIRLENHKEIPGTLTISVYKGEKLKEYFEIPSIDVYNFQEDVNFLASDLLVGEKFDKRFSLKNGKDMLNRAIIVLLELDTASKKKHDPNYESMAEGLGR